MLNWAMFDFTIEGLQQRFDRFQANKAKEHFEKQSGYSDNNLRVVIEEVIKGDDNSGYTVSLEKDYTTSPDDSLSLLNKLVEEWGIRDLVPKHNPVQYSKRSHIVTVQILGKPFCQKYKIAKENPMKKEAEVSRRYLIAKMQKEQINVHDIKVIGDEYTGYSLNIQTFGTLNSNSQNRVNACVY